MNRVVSQVQQLGAAGLRVIGEEQQAGGDVIDVDAADTLAGVL